MFRTLSTGLVLAIALAASPVAAQSHPITTSNPGAAIRVTSTDPIIATYLGTSASFSNDLYLGDRLLFNNQESEVGSTVDLGTFAVGTELVFRLFVRNTETSFFSGSPSRNPDGLGHAAVETNYDGQGNTLVSFEDLAGPEFQSFNDLSFSFTGTAAGAVPEPATWGMMILGFGAVGASLRRRRSTVRTSVRFA